MDLNFLKLGGMRKMGETITASNAVIDPLLATAGITTIKVAGKDVAASDAPLDAKISALAAVNPPGANTQQIADVLVSNDILTRQLSETNDKLVIATASVTSLTLTNSNLTNELTVARASVDTLTAEKAQLNLQLKAATDQFTAKQGELNALNTELSRQCLDYGCLDLMADGKPLGKEATDAQKLAAANLVSPSDKLKAARGAVNAAMAKTGLSFGTVPAAGVPGGAGEKKVLTATERCVADIEAKRRAGITIQLPRQ